MTRVRLLIASLLIGGIVGGLAVWPGSQGLRASDRDPLMVGTREICEAIVANEEGRWETMRQRYFTTSCGHGGAEHGGDTCDALSAAHSESFHFRPGDPIVGLERNADGKAGERSLAAVAARVRTATGERTLTVRWAREGDGLWVPEDVISSLSDGGGAKTSPRRHGEHGAVHGESP